MQNRLTDRKLQSLKRKGKRYEVMDSDVPGFGVRVSEVGQKSFILIARYPGSPNPTRRALGEYPSMSLGEARERAKDWRALIRKGIDPKTEEARLRRLELRKQATTFASVADDFIERHVKGQRKAVDTEREIRKELSEPFAKKGQLQTSLRNWQRKMGDVKPGDHLDLVAEQHEDARAALANMSPADAISVADELLKNALR